jgi:mutator protein MutT
LEIGPIAVTVSDEMSSTNIVTVVAAIIRGEDGRLLITKRHHDAHLGGLWEFPGGKVEDGESLADALKREVLEELGVAVRVGGLYFEQEHLYADRRVHLHFFECRITDGNPVPNSASQMTWVDPSELDRFAFPAANRLLLHKLEVPPTRKT